MKKSRGITLIKLILAILLLTAIGVAIYEIVFQDVLGIMETQSTPITVNPNSNSNQINQQSNKNIVTNTEIINPTLNGSTQQGGETSLGSISHYYYNQLDNYAKIIYRGFEENINNMQTGIYTIDFGTQFNDLLNSSNGEEQLNIAFQSAWNAFTYDYVDIFYIDITKLVLTTHTTTIGSYATHTVDLSRGDNTSYLSDGFSSYEYVKQEKEYVANIKEQVVSSLQGYAPKDQIKYLHNWLIDNLQYDTTYSQKNIHNIYGAFRNGTAVCEGYARAFKYILDGLGIPCVLVSGTGTNSAGETESHAWNYVQLDGKWYGIDVTWDDPVLINGARLTDEVRYKYFLKGSNEFAASHKEDGYISPKSIKFIFPTLEKENY